MIKSLIAIQNELKAPKNNYNSFGKYKYRSAEDILTAVKPILAKHQCQMTISDDVVGVGNRVYIKATVTLIDADGNTETVSAFAREDETKKGMDGSQITGTASSYARKYALNGAFLIDDTKDADTDQYHFQTSDTTPQNHFDRSRANERISQEEVEQLVAACEASGKSIEKALQACKKERLEDLSHLQFSALMAQMAA